MKLLGCLSSIPTYPPYGAADGLFGVRIGPKKQCPAQASQSSAATNILTYCPPRGFPEILPRLKRTRSSATPVRILEYFPHKREVLKGSNEPEPFGLTPGSQSAPSRQKCTNVSTCGVIRNHPWVDGSAPLARIALVSEDLVSSAISDRLVAAVALNWQLFLDPSVRISKVLRMGQRRPSFWLG